MRHSLRVFFLFLAIYLLTFGGHLYSPDEEILFRTTEAMVERGTLSIEPLQGFATKKGPEGQEYAQYGIGQPLLAVPFYYLGKLLYAVLPAEKVPAWFVDTIQYHARTPLSFTLRLGVSFFNLVVCALICAVLFSFAHKLTGDPKAAWMAALLYGFGTFNWVHSKPFFTEPLATLLLFWSFYLLYVGVKEKSGRRLIISGCLFGYALLVRMDSILMLPGFLVLLFFPWFDRLTFRLWTMLGGQNSSNPESAENESIEISNREGENPLQVFAFFIPLVVFVLILLGLNQLKYGAFFSTGYEDQPEGFKFSTPLLAGLYGFLFSAGKGLFFFSPPLVLFFFGIRKLHANSRRLALGLIVTILCFFLVQCKWQNWPGGWCWGPRHIFQVHVFLALPIAFLFTTWKRMAVRAVFWVFLILGGVVQLYGCSQNFIDYHAEFFTTPRTYPNNFNIWYQETESFLKDDYALYLLDEEGNNLKRIPLHLLVSPVQNSIYYPQNSVWRNYIIMLRQGRHDFLWPKIVMRRNPPNLTDKNIGS